jgi:hypothetical protein
MLMSAWTGETGVKLDKSEPAAADVTMNVKPLREKER